MIGFLKLSALDWVIMHAVLLPADLFQNQLFKKNSFRVSNGLDPDQAGHFVGPDLGPASFIYTDWVKEAGLDLHCFQN